MKRALIVVVIVVAVAAVAYFLRIQAIERGRQAREDLVNNAENGAAVPVIVQPVITGQVERIVKYTGTVEPDEQVNVYPKISGRILSVDVDENDRVAKGQTVATIDPEITGQRFEPFEVTAPIEGTISHVFLDPGAYVTQMEPLVTIINDSSVKVGIGVLEKDYHLMKEGTPVRIEFDALAGEIREAKITNRSPVVDARTGTAKAEIRIRNSGSMLRSGMFARVQAITEVHKDAVLMPLAATLTEVLPGRGTRVETTVFVAEEDIARERHVILGLAGPTHYEVLEGLAPGEEVIVLGQNLLRDGIKITVTDPES
ncbi:MAG: efflux RND transporter periplasmic adaptor subunit [Candidatus Eisenbacteria bacterium]